MDPATLAKYKPLKLRMGWWHSNFKPEGARFTRSAAKVVHNFKHGGHDFNAALELLHQSNPTLLFADAGGRHNWTDASRRNLAFRRQQVRRRQEKAEARRKRAAAEKS